MIDLSFQLKGSAVTVVVLALVEFKPDSLKKELQAKIDQSPQFFLKSPLLISLEKFEGNCSLNQLEALLDICKNVGLQPLGFSGVPEEFQAAVKATGLAVLPSTRERELKKPESAAPRHSHFAPQQPSSRPSKFITQPVRSGQQIYAEGTDLVITSQVSEGAEVIADGHIHIYGTLRGRALAGVKGDSNARIFCQNMEAELVSINGDFLLKDSIPEDLIKKPTQVYLADDTMRVEKLIS